MCQSESTAPDQSYRAYLGADDLNPRAMSLRVKGFQPAQSWYQDFTKVTVE